MTPTASKTDALSQAFIWLISNRGGDNIIARVLNQCDKIITDSIPTAAVSIQNNRFVLSVNMAYFTSLNATSKKLLLVHEGGHLILQHIPRLLKLLLTVESPQMKELMFVLYNYAMDMADNDCIVKHEKDANTAEGKEFLAHSTTPATYEFPENLTFEQYLDLLLQNLQKLHKWAQNVIKEHEEQEHDDAGDAPGKESDGKDGKDGKDRKSKGAGSGQGQGKSNNKGECSDDENNDAGKDSTGGNDPASDNRCPKCGGDKHSRTPRIDRRVDQPTKQNINDWAQSHQDVIRDIDKAFKIKSGGAHDALRESLEGMSADDLSDAAQKLGRQLKKMVRTAAEQTKGRGNIPHHIMQHLQPLLAPDTIPWDQLFEEAISMRITTEVEEAMLMPNMSLLTNPEFEPYPGIALKTAFTIAFIVDTSGSVSDDEFLLAINKLNSILRTNKNVRLWVIHCDMVIHHEALVDHADDPVNWTRHGCGGTSYVSAFRRLLKQDTAADWAPEAQRITEEVPDPSLVIVFTDGGVLIEGELFPAFHPQRPIIWLVSPQGRPAPGMHNSAPDRVIPMVDTVAT